MRATNYCLFPKRIRNKSIKRFMYQEAKSESFLFNSRGEQLNKKDLTLKKDRIQTGFNNKCYKNTIPSLIICKSARSPYICTVFFIVLDLRLTKVGVQRYSFFYFMILTSQSFLYLDRNQYLCTIFQNYLC